MCQVTSIQHCQCGATTVYLDNDSNASMPFESYQEKFGEETKLMRSGRTMTCCNYCVNHWGVDLCGCGSGQKVGECDGNFTECINQIPAQELCVKKESVLWAR